ncbi:nucleotidyltransferase substrate binding protein [Aliagarivorans taiwanensis]|uniref:nucleotidyltransferase substrate binding protein n=1 Tax=Aliagarivorans taiwanensis TaxID=561966 RepID=UPI0003F738A4|nr:nucleotidyltransferase substrate binding protein [Aliagarivorans taiwanensis]
MIDYSKLRQALSHLEKQYHNYQHLDASLPSITQEAVAESVIQRFETCWDCLWKVVKRYLNQELGLPEVPNSPKPIMRLAGDNLLLGREQPQQAVEQWLGYAAARIATSHDYSGEKAQQALLLMSSFVPAAIALYEQMSGEQWQQISAEGGK